MNDLGNGIASENTSRMIGKEAQRNNILAAKLVADIIRTTLGPKGMDKMLVDSYGNITVTNDGVTILQEMEIDHPAARMMVEIAKTQETEVGDGTTTAVLLAGKLLERAEHLLDRNIHPTLIASGYKLAAEKSLLLLNDLSSAVKDSDTLKKIAMTAMTGKGAEGNKEQLASLIVNAVEQISYLSNKEIDIENIKIEKIKGDNTSDSELVKGIVLNKERANQEMPTRIQNARILLTDLPIELKNPDIETKISVSTPEQLEGFIASEERYLKEIVAKIVATKANVLICQKGIDDIAQYYLAKAGIFALRRIDKSDLENIARATNGKIVSNLNEVLPNQLGKAEVIEQLKQGNESLVFIRGCENPRTVTIILRGGTMHVLDETERAIMDGLGDVSSAIKSGRIVAGGGAIEIELARRLRIFSKSIDEKEKGAVEQFANALESIPEALAENAGLNPVEVLNELRKTHEQGFFYYGINLFNNRIQDTLNEGIIEPVGVKMQAISSASEVASMILRIDDVLVSKNREIKNHSYQGMD